MILRRVIAHIRKQEWTAIAIDFLIVVLGVFVGLQVSNWNEARVDKVRARGFLERIAGDIDADLEEYADRQRFWSEVSAYGARAVAYADTGETDGRSKWELALAFFQASQVAEFFTTSATWEEMRGGGDLSLISNLDLRRALSRYYTNAGNPALSERPSYREHVREKIPLDVQDYIWNHCYGSDSISRQWFVDCAAPIDEARSAAIVDALAGDAALIGELRYWMSTMNVAARIGRDRTMSATELRNAIAEEIEKS